MVQYFKPGEGVVCRLYSFKECSIDASAEALFQIVHNELLKKYFAKNLVGFISDGAPVMNGAYNSVLSRLNNSYSNLWYLYCINHALHLVACDAAAELPLQVEDFMKAAYKHFKNSAKRIAQFNTVIEGMNLEVKRLLKPGQTRWLSLKLAVDRILSLWEPLLQYFRNQEIEKLIEFMEDPELKIYL